MSVPPPTKPAPISVLSDDELREAWLTDLGRLDPGMAMRYRENRVIFPRSRHDLIRHYNKLAGHDA